MFHKLQAFEAGQGVGFYERAQGAGLLPPVYTLLPDAMERAGAALWQRAAALGPFDAVLAIARGGACALPYLPLPAGLACHLLWPSGPRPMPGPQKIFCTLPYSMSDRLRHLSWGMKTGRLCPPTGALMRQARQIAVRAPQGRPKRVLLLDDAVDTGRTLTSALEALREAGLARHEIVTASFTVTRRCPLVWPDVWLFERKLCRFPWSRDFRPQRASRG